MAFWITLLIGLAFYTGWAFGHSSGYHEAYQKIIEKNIQDKFGVDK